MRPELSSVANKQFLGVNAVPLFDADECDRIIAAVDEDVWAPARVSDYDPGGVVRSELRSVLAQRVPAGDDGWPIRPLVDAVAALNEQYYRFELDSFPAHDAPTVLRYESRSNDEFRAHRDVGEFAPTRKLSCVVQLTDPSDYTGGDLVFASEGVAAVRDRGHLIVFPSFLHHQVTPVIAGVRHVIVGWVHGSSFR